MIQVELLRREKTASDGDQETLRRLAQLAIKGIAAGMRTTG
jgi:phosphoenolpyruvate carboxylase